MSAETDFHYVGNELDLFSSATNWKAYWGSKISPLLGERVLDVGAGLGATAKLLCSRKQSSWLALEPDEKLVERMREAQKAGEIPSHCEIRRGSLIDLPTDAKFDSIVYIDVLEHIELDRAELENAAKHLAPNGRIIVLSPAHNWLFTPFDTALGHFRRYNRELIRKATPPSLVLDNAFYLDSAGMLASLGNRLVLKASSPNARQIQLWDKCLVPVSRLVDPLLAYRLGKSVIAVWRLSA